MKKYIKIHKNTKKNNIKIKIKNVLFFINLLDFIK